MCVCQTLYVIGLYLHCLEIHLPSVIASDDHKVLLSLTVLFLLLQVRWRRLVRLWTPPSASHVFCLFHSFRLLCHPPSVLCPSNVPWVVLMSSLFIIGVDCAQNVQLLPEVQGRVGNFAMSVPFRLQMQFA